VDQLVNLIARYCKFYFHFEIVLLVLVFDKTHFFLISMYNLEFAQNAYNCLEYADIIKGIVWIYGHFTCSMSCQINVILKVSYCCCDRWIPLTRRRTVVMFSLWGIGCLLSCDLSFKTRWLNYEMSSPMKFTTLAEILWVVLVFESFVSETAVYWLFYHYNLFDVIC